MTNETLAQAAKLMADAYKAGLNGQPMPEAHAEHPTLQAKYLFGKHHKETGHPGFGWGE